VSSDGEAQNLLERAKAENLYRRSIRIDPDTGEDVAVLILKSHKSRLLQPGSPFDTYEIYGSRKNYKDIKVFNGQKYDGWFDKLPVPDTLHLSSRYVGAYKHSMTEPNIHETIMSAAGQVSRADYYHQDGRPAFTQTAFDRMDHFVKNFVDVPYQSWRKFLQGLGSKTNTQKQRMRTGPFGEFIAMARGVGGYQNIDGPGFIYALAEWAGKMSDGRRKNVRDEPNIGNALEGAFKMMSGQKLNESEAAAMLEGLETKEAHLFAEGLIKGLEEKQDGLSRENRWKDNANERDWGLD